MRAVLESRATRQLATGLTALIALAAIALPAAGCGGDETTTTTGGGAAGSPKAQEERIRSFGSEASGSRAEAIEEALLGYLGARSDGEWGEACSYLSKNLRRTFNSLAKRSKRVEGCAGLMRNSTKSLSSAERDALGSPQVDSVRTEGKDAFVLYALGDARYAMRMKREGAWKVAGDLGTPLS